MSLNKSFSTETSERYSRALYEVGAESRELEKIESDVNDNVYKIEQQNNAQIFVQYIKSTNKWKSKFKINLSFI